MNDRFLYDYARLPRQEFILSLRSRLEIPPGKTVTRRAIRLRPAALGALGLVLAIAFTLIFSPGVKAQVENWVKQIGEILYIETDATMTPTTESATSTSGSAPAINGKMSLEEARAKLPFSLDLPAWVPEGYALQPEVTVSTLEGVDISVFIEWISPPHRYLTLLVGQRLDGNPGLFKIGEDSMEEVEVNGEPAALVRGVWIGDSQEWAGPQELSLYWAHKGQVYTLYAYEDYISVDELIRIAESIP
jgi:hypothetical protein